MVKTLEKFHFLIIFIDIIKKKNSVNNNNNLILVILINYISKKIFFKIQLDCSNFSKNRFHKEQLQQFLVNVKALTLYK